MRAARAGVLAFLALLWVACAPTRPESLQVQREGTSVLHTGQATLVLRLSSGGQALTTPEVQVQADMTHPGMTPVQAQVQLLGAGRYRVSGLDLGMAGDWVLSVSARPSGSHVAGSQASSAQPTNAGAPPLSGTLPLAVVP